MLLRNADGFVGIVGALVMAIFPTISVHLAARFVWAPVLKKTGLWWSVLVLGCAIAAMVVATGIIGAKLGGRGAMSNLWVATSVAVLFLGWALASIRGIQDESEKTSELAQDSTLIRSRLLRGKRRAHP